MFQVRIKSFQKKKKKINNRSLFVIVYNDYSWVHYDQGQCYKTLYGHNLRIFVISQTASSWQAFPDQSNICGQGKEPTLKCITRKGLHSGRFWPYQQTLYEAGRLDSDKHSSLLQKFVNYGRKTVYNIGPRVIILFQVNFIELRHSDNSFYCKVFQNF